MRTRSIVIATIALLVGGPVQGALVMTITGESGSNLVQFELSGSESIGGYTGNITGMTSTGLQGFDAIGDAFGSAFMRFPILSGSATVLNLTSGDIGVVERVFLRNVGAGDRFGLETTLYRIDAGDNVSWSGSGIIDLAEYGGSFDDLSVGMGTSLLSFPEPEGAGVLVIQEVPEPSIAWILASAILTAGIRRRRT